MFLKDRLYPNLNSAVKKYTKDCINHKFVLDSLNHITNIYSFKGKITAMIACHKYSRNPKMSWNMNLNMNFLRRWKSPGFPESDFKCY